MICKAFDVVEVPFPSIDSSQQKLRKGLIISKERFNKNNKASILTMITSADYSKWYQDVIITDLKKAVLKKSCFVRFKLFTIPNALIQGKTGSLSLKDKNSVKQKLSQSICI